MQARYLPCLEGATVELHAVLTSVRLRDGRVLDPEGRPVAGVRVVSEDATDPLRDIVVTGEDGRFQMPTSTWMGLSPREYGFYANVNPEVTHPRWSQASERRIGETQRRRTVLFNGYEDEVAHLYEDMDLRAWF